MYEFKKIWRPYATLFAPWGAESRFEPEPAYSKAAHYQLSHAAHCMYECHGEIPAWNSQEGE